MADRQYGFDVAYEFYLHLCILSNLGIVIYVTVGMTGDDSTHTIHSTISKEFRETQEVGTYITNFIRIFVSRHFR